MEQLSDAFTFLQHDDGLWASSLAQDPMVDPLSPGAAYARLVSFEAEPEIRTAKLPYYRELRDGDGNQLWFIQATASYLDMDETLRLEISPDYTEQLEASWEGFGVLVEGGLLFPLSDSFTVAPSIGLGVTRVKSETISLSIDVSSSLPSTAWSPNARIP